MSITNAIKTLLQDEQFKGCYVTGKAPKICRLSDVLTVLLCKDEEQRFVDTFTGSKTHKSLIAIGVELKSFALNNAPTLDNQVRRLNLNIRDASAAAQFAREIVEYLNTRKSEYEAQSADVPEQKVAAKV